MCQKRLRLSRKWTSVSPCGRAIATALARRRPTVEVELSPDGVFAPVDGFEVAPQSLFKERRIGSRHGAEGRDLIG